MKYGTNLLSWGPRLYSTNRRCSINDMNAQRDAAVQRLSCAETRSIVSRLELKMTGPFLCQGNELHNTQTLWSFPLVPICPMSSWFIAVIYVSWRPLQNCFFCEPLGKYIPPPLQERAAKDISLQLPRRGPMQFCLHFEWGQSLTTFSLTWHVQGGFSYPEILY